MISAWLPEYGTTQWIVLLICALLVGISKTGMPGIGVVNVPLIALAFSDNTKLSTGLLLPMLAIADIFAVFYYRRYAKWPLVLRLLPWALAGICTGSVIIRYIDDSQLQPIIGIIVMIMLIANFIRNRNPALSRKVPSHWLFSASIGFFAGITTQLANAAGPIMIIYLLAMQLPKEEFIGTGAWYFLILNWLKIPLFIHEQRITLATVKADMVIIPVLAIGALLGIMVFKKIPQQWFNNVVQLLAAAAALKLVSSIFC